MKKIEKQDVEEIIQGIAVEKILGKIFLITGATGAIARYFVHTLMEIAERYKEKACTVIVVCRNQEKANDIFKEYLNSPYFKMVCGQVEAPVYCEESVDYILHAACTSATKFFKSNPADIASANVIGTYNLLSLAREKRVQGFLFFSSGAVYGGNTKDDFSYNGINPLDYQNCYALSKQMGENLCACFAEQYGVPAKVVRIGYTYGPHIDLNDGHLYSDFARDILEYKDIQIKGDGESYIGLCYITDAIRAFLTILFDGQVNTPYVMRNDKEYMPIKKLAQKLVNDAFPERNLGYECMIKASGKMPKCYAREPLLLKQLGWRPQIDVVEGFQRVICCLEEQKEG